MTPIPQASKIRVGDYVTYHAANSVGIAVDIIPGIDAPQIVEVSFPRIGSLFIPESQLTPFVGPTGAIAYGLEMVRGLLIDISNATDGTERRVVAPIICTADAMLSRIAATTFNLSRSSRPTPDAAPRARCWPAGPGRRDKARDRGVPFDAIATA